MEVIVTALLVFVFAAIVVVSATVGIAWARSDKQSPPIVNDPKRERLLLESIRIIENVRQHNNLMPTLTSEMENDINDLLNDYYGRARLRSGK